MTHSVERYDAGNNPWSKTRLVLARRWGLKPAEIDKLTTEEITAAIREDRQPQLDNVTVLEGD